MIERGGVEEKRDNAQRRSKAILVEMVYLPLIRLKSKIVKYMHVNYRLVSQSGGCKIALCLCVCMCVCTCVILLTVIVNCLTLQN